MINIELVKQTSGYCGPSCLRMVARYYGVRHSEKYLAKLCNATRENGCDPEDITRAAKSLGFAAEYRANSSMADLENLIYKGIPPIINFNDPEYEDEHFLIPIGVNQSYVTLADPKLGALKNIGVQRFLDNWRENNDLYKRDRPERKREVIIIKRPIVL